MTTNVSKCPTILDLLAQAEERATPGPWLVSDLEQDKGVTYQHVYTSIEDVEMLWQIPSDAALIALLRNHATDLIAVARAAGRIKSVSVDGDHALAGERLFENLYSALVPLLADAPEEGA